MTKTTSSPLDGILDPVASGLGLLTKNYGEYADRVQRYWGVQSVFRTEWWDRIFRMEDQIPAAIERKQPTGSTSEIVLFEDAGCEVGVVLSRTDDRHGFWAVTDVFCSWTAMNQGSRWKFHERYVLYENYSFGHKSVPLTNTANHPPRP